MAEHPDKWSFDRMHNSLSDIATETTAQTTRDTTKDVKSTFNTVQEPLAAEVTAAWPPRPRNERPNFARSAFEAEYRKGRTPPTIQERRDQFNAFQCLQARRALSRRFSGVLKARDRMTEQHEADLATHQGHNRVRRERFQERRGAHWVSPTLRREDQAGPEVLAHMIASQQPGLEESGNSQNTAARPAIKGEDNN